MGAGGGGGEGVKEQQLGGRVEDEEGNVEEREVLDKVRDAWNVLWKDN